MPRRIFTVTLYDGTTNAEIATATRFAMNSGIRASEALVREHARAEGAIYEGGSPSRVGDVYTRTWTSGATGNNVVARVHLAA